MHKLFENIIRISDLPELANTKELTDTLETCDNIIEFINLIIDELDILQDWCITHKSSSCSPYQLIISKIETYTLMFEQERKTISKEIYDSEINIMFQIFRSQSTGKLLINPSRENDGSPRTIKSFLSIFKIRPLAWIIMVSNPMFRKFIILYCLILSLILYYNSIR